jgi:uncharacterized protein YeaO (DUF488 family)
MPRHAEKFDREDARILSSLADFKLVTLRASSTGLRQWFNHDPAKWAEFQRRYWAELDAKPEVLEAILNDARHGRVTLCSVFTTWITTPQLH